MFVFKRKEEDGLKILSPLLNLAKKSVKLLGCILCRFISQNVYSKLKSVINVHWWHIS